MSGDIQDCNKVAIALIHGKGDHAFAGSLAQNLEVALHCNFQMPNENIRFQAQKLPGTSGHWMVNLDRASLNCISSQLERLVRQYEIVAFVKGFFAGLDNISGEFLDFNKT